MAPPVVQFVDAISATAAIRLNLMNLAGLVVGPDGIDLSPPQLRYSWADSSLSDGARLGAATYENRVLRIPIRYVGTPTADAAAALLSTLGRELNRPSNIMKVQLGSTPVWFRTIRSSYALKMLRLALGERKQTTVMLDIPAEPFGLGARVDLGPYTVNNDPAHATNPQRVTLPAITGDVETPAYIWSATALQDATFDVMPTLAIGRGPTTGSLGLSYAAVQAETGTSLGADTSLPGNDAAMSGAGSNYVRTTFATDATMVNRFSLVSALLTAGRYTVIARVRRSVSGDVVKMRYVHGGVAGNTVTLPAGTNAALVRLGVIQVPFGSSLRENGYSGQVLGDNASVIIQSQRVSGTGNLDVDYLLFVPADYATLTSQGHDSIADWFPAWDGPSEVSRIYNNAAFTSPFTGTNTETGLGGVDGKFPTLLPSGENVLHFLRNIDRGAATGPADSISAATVLNVAYWPRYLVTP